MARTTVTNIDVNPQSDGFKIGGGTTKRTATFTGADVTFTGSGTNTQTFPASSSTLLGASATPTTGSILFFGSSLVTENNSKFFWDNTNFTLGINTTRTGAISGTNPITRIKGSGTSSSSSSFEVQNSSAGVLFFVRDDGLINLGTKGSYTESSGNITTTGTVTGSNLSGTNTGDQTITLTSDVTGSGTGSFATTIVSNAVTNSKLAQMATLTIKGNNTGGTANPSDLTVAQVTAILNTFTSTLQGLVPASGGGTTTFLRADGTFASVTAAIPAGTGVLDFGSLGAGYTSAVITDATVSTSSKITCSLYYNTTLSLGRDPDDMAIDPIILTVVPGSGNFTVHGTALMGKALGKYGFSYIVG